MAQRSRRRNLIKQPISKVGTPGEFMITRIILEDLVHNFLGVILHRHEIHKQGIHHHPSVAGCLMLGSMLRTTRDRSSLAGNSSHKDWVHSDTKHSYWSGFSWLPFLNTKSGTRDDQVDLTWHWSPMSMKRWRLIRTRIVQQHITSTVSGSPSRKPPVTTK